MGFVPSEARELIYELGAEVVLVVGIVVEMLGF